MSRSKSEVSVEGLKPVIQRSASSEVSSEEPIKVRPERSDVPEAFVGDSGSVSQSFSLRSVDGAETALLERLFVSE